MATLDCSTATTINTTTSRAPLAAFLTRRPTLFRGGYHSNARHNIVRDITFRFFKKTLKISICCLAWLFPEVEKQNLRTSQKTPRFVILSLSRSCIVVLQLAEHRKATGGFESWESKNDNTKTRNRKHSTRGGGWRCIQNVALTRKSKS